MEDRLDLHPAEVHPDALVRAAAERHVRDDFLGSRIDHVPPATALGIDATSRYEAVLAGRDRSDVDFESDSPYNTRRNPGLPPTPIASPGRASIEAALNPADGPWIYYVLEDAEGNHFFTESNSEFLAAKERCRDAGLGCG